MREFRYVAEDANRRKAIYRLVNYRLKGFVTEHGTEGLYWFNTPERMGEGLRDLLISADEVIILV